MDVVGKEALDEFKLRHADARGQVDSWLAEAEEAEWATPHDVKSRYPSASILSENRVVFNIKGNSYRLLVRIAYRVRVVLVLLIGTHAEYDRWDL